MTAQCFHFQHSDVPPPCVLQPIEILQFDAIEVHSKNVLDTGTSKCRRNHAADTAKTDYPDPQASDVCLLGFAPSRDGANQLASWRRRWHEVTVETHRQGFANHTHRSAVLPDIG